MLVIGIDPGTATTGYGLVVQHPDGSMSAVDYGVITTSPKTPMPDRLQEIYQSLKNLLAQHSPLSAAVEKLFFQTNVKTAITVAQGRGVILLALAQQNLPIEEYTPLEIKQAVAGYGKADKQQVQQMVRILLGLQEIPRPDDAADALAIAICHLQYARSRELGRI